MLLKPWCRVHWKKTKDITYLSAEDQPQRSILSKVPHTNFWFFVTNSLWFSIPPLQPWNSCVHTQVRPFSPRLMTLGCSPRNSYAPSHLNNFHFTTFFLAEFLFHTWHQHLLLDSLWPPTPSSSTLTLAKPKHLPMSPQQRVPHYVTPLAADLIFKTIFWYLATCPFFYFSLLQFFLFLLFLLTWCIHLLQMHPIRKADCYPVCIFVTVCSLRAQPDLEFLQPRSSDNHHWWL